MMTDPIADMLTRIRNAQAARKKAVEIPFSRIKQHIADILCREGYVGAVSKIDGMPAMLTIELLYRGKTPVIQAIDRESVPGHRKYKKAGEIKDVLNGYGIAILSTSRGLMTNKEAKLQGVGGEILCSVY